MSKQLAGVLTIQSPNPTTARLVELGLQRDLIAELVADNPEAAQRAMDKITEEMKRLSDEEEGRKKAKTSTR